MQNFERERLLDRYIEAFDTGRLELINEVLKVAAADQTLVDMIVEANAVLEEEKGLKPSENERAEARNLLNNWMDKTGSIATEQHQLPSDQNIASTSLGMNETDLEREKSLESSSEKSQASGLFEFDSLIVRGQKKGLSFTDLASQLRLGISATRMLDRRQIEADSIPNRLIEDISQTLELPPAHVASYLKQEPILAQGALYRAKKMPELSKKMSFADALRLDPHMSEDDKSHWNNIISDK